MSRGLNLFLSVIFECMFIYQICDGFFQSRCNSRTPCFFYALQTVGRCFIVFIALCRWFGSHLLCCVISKWYGQCFCYSCLWWRSQCRWREQLVGGPRLLCERGFLSLVGSRTSFAPGRYVRFLKESAPTCTGAAALECWCSLSLC